MKKICLLLSALVLGAPSFAQTLPNAGMETWRNNTTGSGPIIGIHAPVQWYGFDSLVVADAEAFAFVLGHCSNYVAQLFQENTIVNSGTSSAKVMSRFQDTCVGMVPGSLSNASVGVNIPALIGGASIASATTFYGGTPVTSRITNVSAYVRYTPGKDSLTGTWTGKDTGLLNIQTFGHKSGGHDTLVGTAAYRILPSASFTQINAHVVYWDSVNYQIDTIRIVFSSSGGGTSRPCDSSTLYVDDVSMTGVAQPDYTAVKSVVNNNTVVVFPNPTNGILNISSQQTDAARIELTSVSGQVVAATDLTGNDQLDISALPAGMYIYKITDNRGAVIQAGKVSLNK